MIQFKDTMDIKKIIKDSTIKVLKEATTSDESVNEASLSKVYNAAKKGSFPITLVAIENGKVVDQKLVGTPEIVPAAFNMMQKDFPKAQVNVEDRTGKILFREINLSKEESIVEGKSSSKFVVYVGTKTNPTVHAVVGSKSEADKMVTKLQKDGKFGNIDKSDYDGFKKQFPNKLKESNITEAKFHRLPSKLNVMWDLKNSVEFLVRKHEHGEDYDPAVMKSIEEYIKKIKKSAKAFNGPEAVKGTIYEVKLSEADRTSSISKKRAGAELKQQLKGKRADGLGAYTAIVYGMDGGKRVPLKSVNDINKYSEFELGEKNESLSEAKRSDIVIQMYKDVNGDLTGFAKHMVKLEKKLGKKNFRSFLTHTLTTMGVNGDHYDYRDNVEAIRKLHNLAAKQTN